MATNNNLQDFLTDVANAIRTKTGATQPINAQNFSTEILNISTGGGNTLKNLLDATQSCYNLFHEYQGTSVDDLITYNDTSNVIDMRFMFSSAINITSIPLLDTSKVNDISNMFSSCSKLTTIPLLDISKATVLNNTFYSCRALTTVPALDTSKVIRLNYTFYNCSALTTVPALDVSNVTTMTHIFTGCTSLKSILMTGMKVSFDISASTQFEESDLVTILNNLSTVTSTKTLTMGATNLAKLTDEDKAIATNKGWTLA